MAQMYFCQLTPIGQTLLFRLTEIKHVYHIQLYRTVGETYLRLDCE